MSEALFDLPALTTAVLSDDEQYRYRLDRIWDPDLGRALFLMLNPSTADAVADDPTIGRCRGFARREGCGTLTVVNLYGLRSHTPKVLPLVADPVGPDNDHHLLLALDPPPKIIVVAWGAHRFATERAARVTDRLTGAGWRLHCLGVTKDGHPRHPLYVKGDAPLRPYPPAR